ncbi:helix-turn-helix transcriptional regulator [Hyphococcus lacteus]|uniref:Helix-turn-helix domain-containing protein n=1 Tax=Hyphococcus lacteus TaxID=3143536 RepID=A0ABV3Z123_9PROT
MPKTTSIPDHPGKYVKDLIAVKKTSVTDAAKMLGVSRVALSSFLNEKTDLSPDMAVKVSKAFGLDKNDLLSRQAEFDSWQIEQQQKSIAVKAFVPDFLSIKARQIEAWSDDNLEARATLAVMLRKLILSTSDSISEIDFPAYDNSQRHGWDGYLTSSETTPWIPAGISGWEFGCTKEPQDKANSDYKARTHNSNLCNDEKSDTTFVFVTPRNWKEKDEWAILKNKEGVWKSVRAYDASDLEQWFEQSIPAQRWFGEIIGVPRDGIITPENAWQNWSEVTDPVLPLPLFQNSVNRSKSEIGRWLETAPSRILSVSADSTDEALAFVSAFFLSDDASTVKFGDRALIFDDLSSLRKFESSVTPFIAILRHAEMAKEIGNFFKKFHTIVITPRNKSHESAEIELGQLGYEEFRSALVDLNFSDDQVTSLERKTGRSITVLRRQISTNPLIKIPEWAQNADVGRKLIPYALIGAWSREQMSDRTVVELLTEKTADQLDSELVDLLAFNEAPVWSLGAYRGAVSKMDMLFSIHPYVTEKDISDFLEIGEYVLSETDPSIELDEDKRWIADIYGKTRDHSSLLRESICETIILLAVHGNDLFQDKFGMNLEVKIDQIVRRLMTPLTREKLYSLKDEMQFYAEASPEVFLSTLESDLNSENPQILTLLEPSQNAFFGGCPRSGLLWALEGIAWNKKHLTRAIEVLAKLADHQIDDNWSNKPENTLESILKSWMPQTTATLDERIKLLQLVFKKYPGVGWRLAVSQFGNHHDSASPNYKPKWRQHHLDAEFSTVTNKDVNDFQCAAIELCLSYKPHTADTLGDLVEKLNGLGNDFRSRVWSTIEVWSKSKDANDDQKAKLRETIRRFAFTRRGKRIDKKRPIIDDARKAYDFLEPNDLIQKHQWLFETEWVEESGEELDSDDYDYKKRDERIRNLRQNAISEIYNEKGIAGVVELIKQSGAGYSIGYASGMTITAASKKIQLLSSALEGSMDEKVGEFRSFCSGFLFSINEKDQRKFFESLKAKINNEEYVRALTLAPIRQSTFDLVSELEAESYDAYWRTLEPRIFADLEAYFDLIAENMLRVGRPIAAFRTMHFVLEKLSTHLIYEMLNNMTSSSEETYGYAIRPYDVSKAFEIVQSRDIYTEDELASLEFRYISALNDSEYGIPNLESQISKSPALFMQVLAQVYRRNDDQLDPPEWIIADDELKQSHATHMHRVLDRFKKTPGSDEATDEGKVAILIEWIREVRQLCKQYARVKIGDQKIGELLAKSLADENGNWPNNAVCEALEFVATEDVMVGFSIGLFNSRGVHWRGEGGQQERDLAEKYRSIAERVAFKFPFVERIFEHIAQQYDKDAHWQDTEAGIRKRLRY